MTTGYGASPYGAFPYGAGGELQLVAVSVIRENVIRLSFTPSPKFTGLLDVGDGSDPSKYTVTPVPGTIGRDGLPTRAVLVARVELVPGGAAIDVFFDRPMSPWPARYTVAVTGLQTATGDPLDPSASLLEFEGAYRELKPNAVSAAVPNRDIASPDDASALAALQAADPQTLGTFIADETGDYAADAALTSYRKRVVRRCLTRRNGFAHLIGYGVGLADEVKKLATASVRSRIEQEAESQIREEPETVECSARFAQDSVDPSVWWLVVRARTNTGETLNERLPFPSE